MLHVHGKIGHADLPNVMNTIEWQVWKIASQSCLVWKLSIEGSNCIYSNSFIINSCSICLSSTSDCESICYHFFDGEIEFGEGAALIFEALSTIDDVEMFLNRCGQHPPGNFKCEVAGEKLQVLKELTRHRLKILVDFRIVFPLSALEVWNDVEVLGEIMELNLRNEYDAMIEALAFLHNMAAKTLGDRGAIQLFYYRSQ